MKVDLHALETFNRLAHEGAETAAGSLTELTGIGTSVDVTQTTLMDRGDLAGEMRGGDYVGVRIGFDGELAGETVLVFDRDTAASIVDVLVPDHEGEEFDDMAKSGIVEVGNIMVGGFVDGWADYLGSPIDITPPTYVDRPAGNPLELDGDPGDHIFVFESQLELVDERVDFYIYMLPEYRQLMTLLAEQTGDDDNEIPIDKLAVYNRMVEQGAHSASEHVSTMTGVRTSVDVSKLSFVPVEDIPSQLDDREYVGTVFKFSGLPSGYLVILFDEASGVKIAERLVPTDVEADGFTAQHRSAIQELGNIMTSGFVDGWANVLETTVEISTPQFVHDLGPAIMDQVVVGLDRDQHEAFLIGSRIRTEEIDASCDIFALPEEPALRRALEELSVERADETEADPTEHF